jgi:hypothetical protein
VATSGSYADLSGIPVLATVASSGSYADLSDKPVLATVASSGSYTDLTDKPVLFDGDYNTLSNLPNIKDSVAVHGFSGDYTDLANKPTLATVATSGSYADLSGIPVLATVASSGSYADLSDKPINATTTTDGLMSGPDKTKLDGLENADGSETKITAGNNITITGTGTTANPYTINSNSGERYLGEEYLGGIIFYLYVGADGQQHGLIVSKTESFPSVYKWDSSNILRNANKSSDGQYNTNLMTLAGGLARNWVNSLGAGWYVPSIDEMLILRQNRFHVNNSTASGVTPITTDSYRYWTSTETSSSSAFSIEMRGGTVNPSEAKGTLIYVRGVRSF